MNLNKIRTMIGFSVKSGKIIYGADNIEATHKRIYLILAESGLSERTKEALGKIAISKSCKMIILDQRIEDLVYKTNCKAIAILDENMSKNIIMNAGNGGGNLID